MSLTPLVWVDGELGPAARARVPALDHGLTVGDGVFETCKVVHGVPFALTRHLRRLHRSAAVLGLPDPSDVLVRDAVARVLEAGDAPLRDTAAARLRITVTAGVGPLASSPAQGPPRVVVALAEQVPWPPTAAVVTVPWTRNERSATSGAKTTSYAENVVALREAHRQGAHEAILANTAGMLCEGTGSNVLVAMEGGLVTPPLTCGCLAGITRELLLEWAHAEGLPLREGEVSMSALAGAGEVLLTSSTRDVHPVSALDGRALVTGPLGRAAVDLFRRRAAQDTDP
jgi:branched-chain amino acid aminotransferase